jgi:large subunit ribosomal protein L4
MATLRAVTEARKVLVVLGSSDEINWVSLRNVPEVHLLAADQLNTYDVLVADQVVFTQDALAEFLGVPLVEDSVQDASADDTDEDGSEQ